MPRHKTLISMFIDVVVFVSMFALLGHLSMNFWERFIIQTELSNMKTSLHSLKKTINRIGFAYDNLHRELIGLAEITEKKAPEVFKKRDPDKFHRKDTNVSAQTRDNQIQVMTKATYVKTMSPIVENKVVQNYLVDTKDKTTQSIHEPKKSCNSNKNTSTITRYPLKSTGVGLNTDECRKKCSNHESCKYGKAYSNAHKCCKHYQCYNVFENLKF